MIHCPLPTICPPVLLPVRRGPVGSSRSSPGLLRFLGAVSIPKRCSISLILTPCAIHPNIFRASWCVVAMPIDTICLSLSISQISNDRRQLLLEHFDALLNDCIRLKITHTLNLKVECLRDSIIIERFALLRWFLPVCILAFWPWIRKQGLV